MTRNLRYRLRRQLQQRDGRGCVWCGQAEQISIDHVRPQARGGSWWIGNLVLACPDCNSRRGDRLLDEWLALCEREGRRVDHQALQRARARQQDPRCHQPVLRAWNVIHQQQLQVEARLRRQQAALVAA